MLLCCHILDGIVLVAINSIQITAWRLRDIDIESNMVFRTPPSPVDAKRKTTPLQQISALAMRITRCLHFIFVAQVSLVWHRVDESCANKPHKVVVEFISLSQLMVYASHNNNNKMETKYISIYMFVLNANVLRRHTEKAEIK